MRIQRQRTRGWRMPPGAIYVGRPGPFGNPWKVVYQRPLWEVRVDGRPHLRFYDPRAANERAADLFNDAVRWPATHGGQHLGFDPRDVARLRGHDLVCWCLPGWPCHGDRLLTIANAPLRCDAAPGEGEDDHVG